tara:strand:- start:169 stop:861 length:693 start_codon:yes stop_codon:yes gene_type:complete
MLLTPAFYFASAPLFVVFVDGLRVAKVRWPLVASSVLAVRPFHNALLAVYSLYVAFFTLSKLSCSHRADVLTNGLFPLVCVASPGSPALWYASKLWEWLDTAFLIFAGREPGILHLFHHASTAPLVALHLSRRTIPTPLFDVGTLLNGGVHVLMYAYYLFPDGMRPVKRYITLAQIFQHVIVIVLTVAALAWPGCDAPPSVYASSLALYSGYLVLFLRFYHYRYDAKKEQ